MKNKINHPKIIDILRDCDGNVELVIRNHYRKRCEKTLSNNITDWPCIQCSNWDCSDPNC